MTTDQAWLPTAHSLLALEPLLEAIAGVYGLPAPVHGRLLRAWTNDVYEVAAGGRRYILKVYRASWRSPDEVAWEVELQAHLAAHGGATVPVIPRRDGRLCGTLPAPEGSRAVALFGHAEGVKPTPPFDAQLYERFGRATAELHRTAGRFSSRQTRFDVDLSALLDEPLVVIQPWLADRPDDWDLVARVAELARVRLAPLVAEGLDWGVCHGDVSLDNVHVRDDGAIVLFDFDLAGYGWRAWDVSGVWAYQPPEPWSPWEAFLRGYTAVRPFGTADQAAVRYLAAANALHMMASEVGRWTHWYGVTRVVAWMDGTLAWLRRWEDEIATRGEGLGTSSSEFRVT